MKKFFMHFNSLKKNKYNTQKNNNNIIIIIIEPMIINT